MLNLVSRTCRSGLEAPVGVKTVRTRKDGQRIDVSLLPLRLRTFPLGPPAPYPYYWNLSLDQGVESTQTLNIRYVGAAGQ